MSQDIQRINYIAESFDEFLIVCGCTYERFELLQILWTLETLDCLYVIGVWSSERNAVLTDENLF